LAAILKQVTVADIMTSPVRTIDINEPFATAEEIFVKEGIRHLPVVDAQNKLVGILSQRDVYRAISPRRFMDDSIVYRDGIIVDKDGYYEKESLNHYILKHIMRRQPQSVTPDQLAANAVHIMNLDKVGSVPVVDSEKHVLGIVTRTDVLKFLSKITWAQ
jgi:acetoin utilization protein AcuB